jgi:hypothetical protein
MDWGNIYGNIPKSPKVIYYAGEAYRAKCPHCSEFNDTLAMVYVYCFNCNTKYRV